MHLQNFPLFSNMESLKNKTYEENLLNLLNFAYIMDKKLKVNAFTPLINELSKNEENDGFIIEANYVFSGLNQTTLVKYTRPLKILNIIAKNNRGKHKNNYCKNI